MGVMTDYFVATPERAAALVATGPHGEDVPMLELKRVEPAVLGSTLWAVIEGVPVREPYRAPFDLERYDAVEDMLADGDATTHGVFVLADGFVRALATLPDARVAPVAALWGTAEEWGGPLEPGALDGLVRELRDLAREVRDPGQHMYVWWCV